MSLRLLPVHAIPINYSKYSSNSTLNKHKLSTASLHKLQNNIYRMFFFIVATSMQLYPTVSFYPAAYPVTAATLRQTINDNTLYIWIRSNPFFSATRHTLLSISHHLFLYSCSSSHRSNSQHNPVHSSRYTFSNCGSNDINGAYSVARHWLMVHTVLTEQPPSLTAQKTLTEP